jgi:hypothetical protein
MKYAALIAWVATAGGGFVMLSIWLRNGGPSQQGQPGQRIRPPLIFGHFGLAAAGLVVWIVYLVAETDALKWVAFAALVPVALLGFAMLAIWIQRRQGARAGATTGGTLDTTGSEPAEQRFPVPIVIGHGLLAVTTVVLVLLTAAGIGD